MRKGFLDSHFSHAEERPELKSGQVLEEEMLEKLPQVASSGIAELSMAGESTTSPRRKPRQKRGERRVADLVSAAAGEFAEVGYDAATMSAIARRAGASIGSLYQFFPNKESLARALRTQYAQEYEQLC